MKRENLKEAIRVDKKIIALEKEKEQYQILLRRNKKNNDTIELRLKQPAASAAELLLSTHSDRMKPCVIYCVEYIIAEINSEIHDQITILEHL